MSPIFGAGIGRFTSLVPAPFLGRSARSFTSSTDLTVRPRTNTALLRKSRSFGDVGSFLDTGGYRGVYSVWDRGLPIDMSLSVKRESTLTVVFHGAANENVRFPWLPGRSVTDSLPTSRLSITDPSLYLSPDLNLAWFSGSYVQPDLIAVLSKIINAVADDVGAERVVLFGGSGGGYIALRLLRFLRHATAVVMNPQTDIEKYYDRHVQNYVDIAWEGDHARMRSVAGSTVYDAVNDSIGSAKVIYLQNKNDDFHSTHHLRPFRERFNGTENFILLEQSWEDGHTPPPKEVIRTVLAAAIGDNRQALTDELGFTQL